MVSWLNLVQSNLSQQFCLDLGKRFRQRSCTPVECFRGPGGEGGGGGLDSHEEREGLLENMAGGYFLGIVRKYRQRASGTWPERVFCLEAFVVRVRGGSRGVIWRMQTRGRMGLWGGGAVINIRRLPPFLPPWVQLGPLATNQYGLARLTCYSNGSVWRPGKKL